MCEGFQLDRDMIEEEINRCYALFTVKKKQKIKIKPKQTRKHEIRLFPF